MTFILSKLFWRLLAPSNALFLCLVLGFAFRGLGWRGVGTALLATGGAALVLVLVLPVGTWLATVIENRFPQFAPEGPIEGIIVLGGGVDQRLTLARGQVALGPESERFTAVIALARRFPDARLAFTGGNSNLGQDWPSEAAVVGAFWQDLGFDVSRVSFEDRSRNTWENAVFSRERLRPQPDQRWLLVTSAMHMPRAVGCFRQAGWNVVPYAVDFTTTGSFTLDEPFNVAHRLAALDQVFKELIGLAVYRMLGRTGSLFPQPAAPT
ncbi:YdcF family protein [Marinivivus vitaminiproducens]|uniref:YdcF family protein n=1 Tax=Marinivivus vitaminiproducens TaxID=3035935 RepID=UPI00279BA330|nr:YdcF family protein [Geminicoccaceae bacterium SCSIO 64248]